MNAKQTGSFYTPKPLAKYMSRYAMQRIPSQRVLEPSVGDGRFIESIMEYQCDIDAVEIDFIKINEIKNKYYNVNLICTDFIKFALDSNKKYNLIIGNPPYISKKVLTDDQRELSWKLTEYWSLPNAVFQNLWVSFVLGALKLLDHENGAIFYILPFEFLQVQYAEKLRNFLEEKFNYIEITTFKESVFPQIEQDVCLVYMTNIKDIVPVIKYITVNSFSDMNIIHYSEICRNKPLKKWSNSILDDDETELLQNLQENYIKISELGDTSPGIVTGANSFFIINTKKVEELNCKDKVLPILQHSTSIGNSLILKNSDIVKLQQSNKSVWMLNLSGVEEDLFSPELKDYLDSGVNRENDILSDRYKCKQRLRWYDVPVIKNGNIMFFKRYNMLPRLIVNSANVYTTDISYNIRLKEKFDPSSVAFCFYNSLTLALCEYNGRFYGGGVGELVPSEFKSLCLPYRYIDIQDINQLDMMFRENALIEDIIDFIDSKVFANLDKEQILKLKKIRNKYLERRIKR